MTDSLFFYFGVERLVELWRSFLPLKVLISLFVFERAFGKMLAVFSKFTFDSLIASFHCFCCTVCTGTVIRHLHPLFSIFLTDYVDPDGCRKMW